MTAGFDVFVQLVMAAIRTAPSRISTSITVDIGRRRTTGIAIGNGGFEVLLVGRVGDAQRDPILRTLGTRDTRLDIAHVELQRVGVQGIGLPIFAPQTPVRARTLSTSSQCDSGSRPESLEVTNRLAVDRKDARRSSRTPATCCPASRDPRAACRRGRRRRTRQTCRRHLSREASQCTVSTRSVAVATFLQFARQLETDDVRESAS